MKAYDNLGGNSGVVAYDYDSEVIKVQFDDGWICGRRCYNQYAHSYTTLMKWL